MIKTTKPKAVKSLCTQAKSSPAGGKKAGHTRKKPSTTMAGEAHQSEANDDELDDPTSPATTSAPKAPMHIVWDKYPERTERLLDYLDAHPDVTLKLFRDSTQAARLEGHAKLTAKSNKGTVYLQVADGIFLVNNDPAVRADFATNPSKYTKAIDNYITNT